MEPLSCEVDRRVSREFNEVPQGSPFWHRCQTLPIIIRVNLLWRARHTFACARVRVSGVCAGRFGGKGWRNTGDVPEDFGPVGGSRYGGALERSLSMGSTIQLDTTFLTSRS